MKLPIYTTEKNKAGEKQLPAQFGEEYRPDLIQRAVIAFESAARQLYGSNARAGLRKSARTSKRRRDYRTTYGYGISRVARKIFSRRGTRMSWAGASTPQTRGGRRAHPPKSEKIQEQKINQKEKQKAVRSAMAATLNKELVTQRGHKVPATYPFILSSAFENMTKTKEVEQILTLLGFEAELIRSSIKKIRAGKGKLRGRPYRRKKGILIVVGQECPLIRAAQNVPGVDVITVRSLNAHILAPGAMPGRVTLWTENAINVIEKERLFC